MKHDVPEGAPADADDHEVLTALPEFSGGGQHRVHLGGVVGEFEEVELAGLALLLEFLVVVVGVLGQLV